jgi:hypothetical protein
MIKEIQIHLTENICECESLPDWEIIPGEVNGIRLSCEHCGAEYFTPIRSALLVLEEGNNDNDPDGEPVLEDEALPDVKGNVVQLIKKAG